MGLLFLITSKCRVRVYRRVLSRGHCRYMPFIIYTATYIKLRTDLKKKSFGHFSEGQTCGGKSFQKTERASIRACRGVYILDGTVCCRY
jgi:hypothetical protein